MKLFSGKKKEKKNKMEAHFVFHPCAEAPEKSGEYLLAFCLGEGPRRPYYAAIVAYRADWELWNAGEYAKTKEEAAEHAIEVKGRRAFWAKIDDFEL